CDALLGCEAGTPPSLGDGIGCTVDSCDEATDTIVHTPDDTVCDDTLFCNGAETCDAALGCQSGTAPVVNDGVACTVDSCDEAADTVVHAPNDAACDDSLFCNGAETCDALLDCRAGTAPSIDDGVGCTVDTCNEATDSIVNTPDDTACDDTLFCNGSETCDAALDCQPGTAPSTDDGVACTVDSCDEAADTVVHAPDDTACDDTLFCNGAETCNAVAGCQPGTPPATDDGIACTLDGCNEVTDTVFNSPDDTACDDTLFCSGAETCDAALGCQLGSAPSMDDGVGCTVDTCDEATDSAVNTPDDTACDDTLFCNGAETCDALLDCQAGTAPATDDGVGCTVDSCNEVTDSIVHAPDDTACDDALFCNGAETCDALLDCQAGAAPSTNDGVACTIDSCDEATDSIVNTPDDTVCDDTLFCNGAETCDAALGCQSGTAPVVNDGVGCTVDSCDEATDSIVNTPDDTACDDALFCNGAETCDALLDCQSGTAPATDDGVGCTVDSCDEATDSIVNTPDDTACDDSLFCNGAETCDALLDCQAGTAPVIDDGVGCTVDSCDEATDSIVNTPDDTACDDTLYCNGVETCDAALDCQAGTPPSMDDGVSCTVDTCDEATDSAVHTPDDGACDDGLFCTGTETCDAVLDCQAGTPPVCNDSDSCTTDLCSGVTDSCEYTTLTIDPASTVTASSTCLTLNSGAWATVFVDLRDSAGVPISGATLTPRVSAGEPISWSTAMAESAAMPGIYWGTFSEPGAGASTAIEIDFDACSQTGTLAGSVTVTYGTENTSVGGTGGCAGPDGNLRVRVLRAEDDTPLVNANVIVGTAAGTPFVTDPEVFLVGGAPNVSNVGVTVGPDGYVTFADLGTALDGPITVTAGQPTGATTERAYFTFADVSAADLVIPLTETDPTIPTVRLDLGTASNFSATGSTSDLQGGLVLPQVTMTEVTSLSLASLLEPNRCVDLPGGNPPLAMPENLWVPEQCMAFFCLARIYEHEWAVTLPQNHRMSMVQGTLPSSVAQNMCEWSELLQGFSLDPAVRTGIGFVPSADTGSSSSGYTVPLNRNGYVHTLNLTTANRPANTDVFAAVFGDHAGSNGLGPNYVNGFRFQRYDSSPGSVGVLYAVDAASTPDLPLPLTGDPATAYYWAAAIATYFDAATSRPAGFVPPLTAENGASTVLWRDNGSGGSPISITGNSTWTADDFLGIAKVAADPTNKTFYWDDVASTRTPHLSVHELYREKDTYRDTVIYCSDEKDVVSTKKTVEWEVWRPYGVTCTGRTGGEVVDSAKECFTLPTLPATWPRAGADAAGGKFDGLTQISGGGEACTGAGDCGINNDACELFGGRCAQQTHKACTVDADCGDCMTGDVCTGVMQVCVDATTANSSIEKAYWGMRVDSLGLASGFDFNAFDLPERSIGMTHESSNFFPLNR
ncbi:MAG: hypothetical protein P1V51_24120, partial [Deltaproteobacteria bacterium]|nr:hypothetical protein [Deltaproteobacteria bacterium]